MGSIQHALSRPSANRDFFWLLVRRDLKVRYAGSTLGALWNLIHPVVMILIYMVIFSSLISGRGEAGQSSGSYVVHLCSGMLVWLVFAEVLSRTVSTLVDNGNFLQKISFPPLILHASIIFNVLFIYIVGLAALWIILIIIGLPPPLTAIGVVPIMVLLAAGAGGLGMILSTLHVFFRDTAQVVIILLQIGFWLNPIVYPKSLLGDRSSLLSLNPVEHFVSTAQALFGTESAQPWEYAPAVIVIFPILSLIAGLVFFRRMLPEVRDGL